MGLQQQLHVFRFGELIRRIESPNVSRVVGTNYASGNWIPATFDSPVTIHTVSLNLGEMFEKSHLPNLMAQLSSIQPKMKVRGKQLQQCGSQR